MSPFISTDADTLMIRPESVNGFFKPAGKAPGSRESPPAPVVASHASAQSVWLELGSLSFAPEERTFPYPAAARPLLKGRHETGTLRLARLPPADPGAWIGGPRAAFLLRAGQSTFQPTLSTDHRRPAGPAHPVRPQIERAESTRLIARGRRSGDLQWLVWSAEPPLGAMKLLRMMPRRVGTRRSSELTRRSGRGIVPD
jgi:hypothetical protein